MKRIEFMHFKTAFIPVVCCVLASTFSVPALAQESATIPLGVPQDWSHRHVIYSNPDTQEEAAAKGTLDEWNKKANDPRFVVQLEKKEQKKQAAAAAREMADDADLATGRAFALGVTEAMRSEFALTVNAANVTAKGKKKPPAAAGTEMHRDWSNVMGGVAGVGKARLYPAKFSFTTDSKSCTDDFIVFATSSAGATASGTIVLASRSGTFSSTGPAADQLITITNSAYAPAKTLTITADNIAGDIGTTFSFTNVNNVTSQTNNATNLARAISRNGGEVGVTARTNGSSQVIIEAITPGNINNISVTETLANFNMGNGALSGGSGGAGQPTIFALNQLYKTPTGCQTATQAVPATHWSYNTGTGAVADLSPVLSFYDNGAQVAFIQRSSLNVASLVLLKWSSSSTFTLGQPTVPNTASSAANYRSGCTLPCMLTFPLGANNTNSAPYVDYPNDILYVGDDTGKLHKFTGVFAGDPAEETISWPVTVSTGNVLSSPVFDGTGLIFVGSNCAANTTNCNRLHSVSTGGALDNSGAIGSGSIVATTGGNGVRDGPIVDSTANMVYAFAGADNASNIDSLGSACNGAGTICAAVYQFSTASSFASQNSGLGAKVFVGLSAANNNLDRAMNAGAFDDAYYSSSGASGSLYVCGSIPGTARRATLWRITITSNAFSARTQGPQLADNNTNDGCSPVTVIKNGANEYLFASVNADEINARSNNVCTANTGCTFVYDLNNLTSAWSSTTNANAALPAPGGTGGIIVDNTLTLTGGGSQIYYSTRTSPGIAVQASQAGLN